MYAVYPQLEAIHLFVHHETDIALFRTENIRFHRVFHIFGYLRLIAVKLHLVLVYLSLVEYLVYEQQQALGVMVYSLDIFLPIAVADDGLKT